MALERTEVEKIAHLARLGLSEADLPRTTETLNNILGLWACLKPTCPAPPRPSTISSA